MFPAHHPIANGLVERFHRQLKTSLKAQVDPNKWTESLPLILLGIRTAVKSDYDHCVAERVYGTTLRLPGEFFDATSEPSQLEPTNYVHRLKRTMQCLQPPAPRSQQRHGVHIPPDLKTCTHVFVRRDAVRKPLQPPYDGPFKVISRSDKHFVIDLNTRQDTVSIDRLKSAYIDTTKETPNPTPVPVPGPSSQVQRELTNTNEQSSSSDVRPIRTTRSGRHVHWPKRFVTFVRF